MPEEKIKCLQCSKLVPESESDNCEECGKDFCSECLIYQEEMAFCEKCRK